MCSDFDVEDPSSSAPEATLSQHRGVSASTSTAFTRPTALVARAPGLAGPVAEGWFGRGKESPANAQVHLDAEGSSVSSVPVVGGASPGGARGGAVAEAPPAPKRDKRNLLPKTKPFKVRCCRRCC